MISFGNHREVVFLVVQRPIRLNIPGEVRVERGNSHKSFGASGRKFDKTAAR